MKENIPVFNFVIDESSESGVKCISMVGDPAMNSMFIAFEKEIPKPKFIQFQSYEQVVFGIAMQPDMPIYREDEKMGAYYGIFSKETIKQIVHKFHREQQTKNMNLDHNEQKQINAYMFSDYIVDSELQIEDLKAKGIPDAKLGSWLVAYKIQDKNVFEKVLQGEVSGFSIEAMLDTEVFSQINKNKNKMEKSKKSLLQKLVQMFSDKSLIEEIMNAEIFERALIPELGFELEWAKPGEPVNKVDVDPNGNEVLSPIGPGEFKTDAGVVVVDEASNLVEVRDLPVEAPASTEPVSGNTEIPAEVVADEEVLVDPMVDPMVPEEVPAEPVVDVKTKTIGEVVGENDGEYWVKVVVEGGIVTQAEVSSETDLLKTKLSEVEAVNKELEKKLAEPIAEPVLDVQKVTKPFTEMSAYEKALHNAQMRRG